MSEYVGACPNCGRTMPIKTGRVSASIDSGGKRGLWVRSACCDAIAFVHRQDSQAVIATADWVVASGPATHRFPPRSSEVETV